MAAEPNDLSTTYFLLEDVILSLSVFFPNISWRKKYVEYFLQNFLTDLIEDKPDWSM